MPRGVYKRKGKPKQPALYNAPASKSNGSSVRSAIVLLKQAVAAIPRTRLCSKGELLTQLALKVLQGE